MEHVVLKLHNDSGSYFSTEERHDGNLITLAGFLRYDIGCSKDSVENRINFINDPNREWISSNYSFMDKEEDGTIILGCDLDFIGDDFEKAYEKAYADALRFEPQQLIDILNQWYELCSRKVQYIIITQDDDNNFTITGKDSPDSSTSDY